MPATRLSVPIGKTPDAPAIHKFLPGELARPQSVKGMMMLYCVQVVCRDRGKRTCVASQTITNRLGVADAVAVKLEHPASGTAVSKIAAGRNDDFPFPEAPTRSPTRCNDEDCYRTGRYSCSPGHLPSRHRALPPYPRQVPDA